jgi:putative membrane protein
MAGADAGAPATTALSDGQILQITHFANSGEVAQANVALSMTKDARVRAFAKMMVSDHGDADVHGAEIAKKEGIVLADSPASASLKSGGDAELADLKGRNGTDFDKAYVDAQVKEHQDVLDGIDTKLLPNAKDLELKAYLMEVRVKVAEHLAHARKLQSDLKKTS